MKGGASGLDTQSMPKIELHAHLSGSISRQCLHEVWVQKKSANGDSVNGEALYDPLLKMPVGKVDFDVDTFFPLFSKFIYALVNDAPSITYTTNSVLKSFQDDGVVYLELRTTPRAIPASGITKDSYVALILSCISSFSSPSMTTRLILSIDRRNTASEAEVVVDLALKYRAQSVVGIDLCGDPAVGDVSIFRAAFARAKAAGLAITLHLAEVPQSSSDNELRTLLDFEPDRIAHVVHVPERWKAVIRARRIGLELCLSCNVNAKLTTGGFAGHHFGEWWAGAARSTCPVVLCTDDVGVFNSALSNEYALVREHFHLPDDEILALARSGIDCIFGGEDEKRRLRAIMWGQA